MIATVVGPNGLMGRAIVEELYSRGHLVVTLGRSIENSDFYFNLEDPYFRPQHRADVVFMCAYVTGVDQCERDLSTWVANVSSQIKIIDWAEKIGARVVFPSSSYVFGNKTKKTRAVNWIEEDVPAPKNVYGFQKLTVEKRILASPFHHLILRTVGLFGEDDSRRINYPYQVYNSQILKAPMDQYMNPIHIEDFAKIAVSLVEMGQSGIFHIAGRQLVTKWAFATKVAKAFEERGVAVPFPNVAWSKEMEQQADRPRFGGLDTSKIEALGFEAPWLDLGIEKFVSRVLEKDAELHLSS